MAIDKNGKFRAWWEDASIMDGKLDEAPLSTRGRDILGAWGRAEQLTTIGGDLKTDRLSAIQYKLARAANAVRNTADKEDNSLSIAWSDGNQSNDPTTARVYISPDTIMAEDRGSVSEDIAIDALTGQVFLASAMKRTLDRKCWNQANADTTELAKPTSTIWRALETAVARHDIIEKQRLPGAADYFKRHAERSASSKEELQKAIDTLKPSVELAAAALAWNVQYPGNKVTVPKEMRRAVDNGAEELKATSRVDASRRYEICRKVAEVIKAGLSEPASEPEQPSSMPEPKPNEQGNDQEGEGDGDGEGEKQEQPEQEQPEPEGGDEQPEQSEPEDGDGEGDGEGESEPEEKPEDEKPDGEGDGDDEGEGDGDGEGEGDAGDGEAEGEGESGEGEGEGNESPAPAAEKPEGIPPEVTDPGLFGAALNNFSTEADKLPSSIELNKADIDPLDGIKVPDGLVDHAATRVHFVTETDPTAYKAAVQRMRPQINALQAVLRFRNNDTSMWNRGCTSGDLDEGSLDKLSMREQRPAIWERRELFGQPKVAVALLIDQSGSMDTQASDPIRGTTSQMEQAKDVAIAMAEALHSIKGVALSVFGHNTSMRGWAGATLMDSAYFKTETRDCRVTHAFGSSSRGTGLVEIAEWYTKEHQNPWAIPHARTGGGNYDSYAMEYCVEKMLKDYPDYPRRILFVISDGAPCGDTGARSGAAMEHMRMVCSHARRHQVAVYGLGICNAYTEEHGVKMYGPKQFTVINNVTGSMPILTAFIRQVCQKA